MYSYAPYAISNPDEIQFVAVAEPDNNRREKFRQMYSIEEANCFSSWEALLEQPKFADAILICTQDNMHFEPAVRAMKKGYHVLLEKPMSPDPVECILLEKHAEENDRILSICHVLRYTEFFTTIKKLLDSEKIGKLLSIQHNENVAYWHQAHSFVRGHWRNSKESCPMILAKCCHDMDLLLWLVGSDCVNISSFGSLSHFKKENAPVGAPLMCVDGCPAEEECPYYAPNIYLTGKDEWPVNCVSDDTSIEAVSKALKTSPYGRCVYHCDNDVVDHQVVNLEFANEVTAAFTMCAFTNECTRTIKLMGSKGEIRGAMDKNEIEITYFSTGAKEVIRLKAPQEGHGGGDFRIIHDFAAAVRSNDKNTVKTAASKSVQSHLLSFAAEKSRLERRVINLEEFCKDILNNNMR